MNNFNFTIIEGLIRNPRTEEGKFLCEVESRRETADESIVISVAVEVKPGKLAEVCEKYLKDGSKALISGKLVSAGLVSATEINFLK